MPTRSNPNFKRCPRCGTEAVNADEIERIFGWRTRDGRVTAQSYCRVCRATAHPAATPEISSSEQAAVNAMLATSQRIDEHVAVEWAIAQRDALAESYSTPISDADREFMRNVATGEAQPTPARRTHERTFTFGVRLENTHDNPAQNHAFTDPLTPPQINWDSIIPISTTPLAFTYIDRVSVELEGGFTRELPVHCIHEHSSICRQQRCRHTHSQECEARGATRCRCCTSMGQSRCLEPCRHTCEGLCLTNCSHDCRTDTSRGARLMCVGGYHGDGSVYDVAGRAGEVSCPEPCVSMAELLQYVTEYHPDSVNASCGTHFHVSVKNHAVNYNLLAERVFYDLFMHRLNQWVAINVTTPSILTRIENRIAGTNIHCKKSWQGIYTPDAQRRLIRKGDARYAHLNYCENIIDSVTGLARKTMECRVFHGMKTPAVIMSAAECLFRCVEDWLAYRNAQIATQTAERELSSII